MPEMRRLASLSALSFSSRVALLYADSATANIIAAAQELWPVPDKAHAKIYLT
jgi:hypothetical protein